MREIKFRVWSLTNRMFVAGWLDLPALHPNDFFKKSGLIFQQYTGLKDKKGKEIYEGDIIMNHLSYDESWGGQRENPIGAVKWISMEDGYDFSGWDAHPVDLPWGAYNNVEVIGNIFENSDLLK